MVGIPARDRQDRRIPEQKHPLATVAATCGWSDERVERAVKLFGDGLTAAQIAADIGGVTRNAVIGKLRRIGVGYSATVSSPGGRRQAPRQAEAREIPWSDEAVAVLKAAWLRGLSGAAIAAEVSELIGKTVTANAVTTKGGRLGLPALGHRQERSRKARPVARVEAPAVAPNDQHLGLLDLDNGNCHWPIGHPRAADFHFCGDGKPVDGKPYCTFHMRAAYVPLSDRLRSRDMEKAA